MVIYHDGKPVYMLLLFSDITVAVAGIKDAHCVVLVFSSRLSMKTLRASWAVHFYTCRFIKKSVGERSLGHYSEVYAEL